MFTRTSIRMLAVSVFGATILAASSVARGGQTQEEQLLWKIKRELGPMNELALDVTWYVILLRERTERQIAVLYVKVQGQEAAARAVYEFLTQPTAGHKDFAGRRFRNTRKGRRDATEFHQAQVAAGLKSAWLLSLSR